MSRKNIFAIFVMFGLGLGIFWWEARNIDFESLITTVQNLNYFWLFIAFVSILLSYGVEATVLHTLLKKKKIANLVGGKCIVFHLSRHFLMP
jgi:Uncharacterised protein family (UPF0104).